MYSSPFMEITFVRYIPFEFWNLILLYMNYGSIYNFPSKNRQNILFHKQTKLRLHVELTYHNVALLYCVAIYIVLQVLFSCLYV